MCDEYINIEVENPLTHLTQNAFWILVLKIKKMELHPWHK
jgi:hypothetical protein